MEDSQCVFALYENNPLGFKVNEYIPSQKIHVVQYQCPVSLKRTLSTSRTGNQKSSKKLNIKLLKTVSGMNSMFQIVKKTVLFRSLVIAKTVDSLPTSKIPDSISYTDNENPLQCISICKMSSTSKKSKKTFLILPSNLVSTVVQKINSQSTFSVLCFLKQSTLSRKLMSFSTKNGKYTVTKSSIKIFHQTLFNSTLSHPKSSHSMRNSSSTQVPVLRTPHKLPLSQRPIISGREERFSTPGPNQSDFFSPSQMNPFESTQSTQKGLNFISSEDIGNVNDDSLDSKESGHRVLFPKDTSISSIEFDSLDSFSLEELSELDKNSNNSIDLLPLKTEGTVQDAFEQDPTILLMQDSATLQATLEEEKDSRKNTLKYPILQETIQQPGDIVHQLADMNLDDETHEARESLDSSNSKHIYVSTNATFSTISTTKTSLDSIKKPIHRKRKSSIIDSTNTPDSSLQQHPGRSGIKDLAHSVKQLEIQKNSTSSKFLSRSCWSIDINSINRPMTPALGSGTSGSVFRVNVYTKNLFDVDSAVTKIIPAEDGTIGYREARFQRILRPYCPRVLSEGYNQATKEYWIISQECVPHIIQIISKLTGKSKFQCIVVAAFHFTQFLCACQVHNIIYHDFKPSNCVYDPISKSFLVCDLGSASFHDPQSNNFQLLKAITYLPGTPFYFPPESQLGKGIHTMSMDIWALGITLLRLGACTHPVLFQMYHYAKESNEDLYKFLNSKEFHNELPCFRPIDFFDLANPAHSPNVKLLNDFISQCLDVNHLTRSSAFDLLAHPLFTNLIDDTIIDTVCSNMVSK